jgi:hypothetical protein
VSYAYHADDVPLHTVSKVYASASNMQRSSTIGTNYDAVAPLTQDIASGADLRRPHAAAVSSASGEYERALPSVSDYSTNGADSELLRAIARAPSPLYDVVNVQSPRSQRQRSQRPRTFVRRALCTLRVSA